MRILIGFADDLAQKKAPAQWAENTALDPFVHKAKKLTKIPQRLPRKNTGNLKNNFKEFFKNSDWFYR